MISVIACTNREEFVPNIMANFQRQSLKEKELILIVHSSNFHVEGALHFPNEMSLGECLNEGVSTATYKYVTKMDDDDYYGSGYLTEVYESLLHTGADVVGKSSFYLYFQQEQLLQLYNPNQENRWIVNHGPYKTKYFLSGATLAFKKEILSQVAFPAVNLGEDSSFQQMVYFKGLKMYCLSKEHYAYVRYPKQTHHHSDVSDSLLKRRSQFVTYTSSVEEYFKRKKQ